MKPAKDTRRERIRQKLSKDVADFLSRGGRIKEIARGESVPTRTWVLNPEWEEQRR